MVNEILTPDLIPFVWFDQHKTDEYRYNLPKDFKPGERKFIRLIIEPSPRSDSSRTDVPFKLVFKATDF